MRSSHLIDSLLVGVAGVLQRGRFGCTTIFTFRYLLVLPAAFEAAAILLHAIYLFLWYKVLFVTSLLLLVFSPFFQLYPILKGKLLASILVVILVEVLVPALEFCNDIHAHELLAPFIRVYSKVLIVCHTAAQGTCKLVDNDINDCPILYFGVGVQSINCVKVFLDWASLPELVNLWVCPICAVIVSII